MSSRPDHRYRRGHELCVPTLEARQRRDTGPALIGWVEEFHEELTYSGGLVDVDAVIGVRENGLLRQRAQRRASLGLGVALRRSLLRMRRRTSRRTRRVA